MAMIRNWMKKATVVGRKSESEALVRHSEDRIIERLSSDYEGAAREFYKYLPADIIDVFLGDAIYHRMRYMDMLSQEYGDRILELGCDKPFISHFVRQSQPNAEVSTISIDVPFSPYPIVRVDIEEDEFPFADGEFSDIIFTEVLEHLFRDPAWTAYQMNRVLRMGGKLLLTTPNACGYDVLVNLLHQVPPNGRNQFYECVESGHPHLWTGGECTVLLEAHGFRITEMTTVDYYQVPVSDEIRNFLKKTSIAPDMNGQVIRIVAEKVASVKGPTYSSELFPTGKPVQLQGALLEWATKHLGASDGSEALERS